MKATRVMLCLLLLNVITPCFSYAQKVDKMNPYAFSQWIYRATEMAETGMIVLNDKDFVFYGFKSKGFVSKGIWENRKSSDGKDIILLQFKDNSGFWSKYLTSQGKFEGVINEDAQKQTIELEVLHDGPKKYLNFKGWNFYLYND